MTKAIVSAMVGLSFIWLVGCSGAKGGAAIATVGGEPITREKLNEYILQKRSVRVQVQNQQAELPVAESLGVQALRDLVTQKLLEQLAKTQGVDVTTQDIDNEIKLQTELDPQYIQKITGRGLTLGQLKEALRIELLSEKILTKGITVPMTEVEAYIKNNPRQFREPAAVDLLWILVKDEAGKKAVDRALQGGQNFRAVALQYSVDPEAKIRNGMFPLRNLDALPAVIKDPVSKAGIGTMTEWVKSGEGAAKFYVDKKTEPKPIKMTPAIKQKVQREMAKQKGRAANDLEKRLLEKYDNTKIDVTFDLLKEEWKRSEERRKRAMEVKKSTGAVPPPAGTPGATGTTGTTGATGTGTGTTGATATAGGNAASGG